MLLWLQLLQADADLTTVQGAGERLGASTARHGMLPFVMSLVLLLVLHRNIFVPYIMIPCMQVCCDGA